MIKLSKEELIKLANKIYIQPTEEVIHSIEKEIEILNRNLQALIQIDVTNIEPLARVGMPIINLRDDEPNDHILLDKSIVLNNAKDKDHDFVLMKGILKK